MVRLAQCYGLISITIFGLAEYSTRYSISGIINSIFPVYFYIHTVGQVRYLFFNASVNRYFVAWPLK